MRATGRCPLAADARRRADQVRLSSCRSSSGVIASRLHRSFGAVSDPCARAVCPHQPATRLLQCTKMQPKTRKPSKAEARKQRNRATATAAWARKQGTAGGASKGAEPGRCHFSGLNGTRLTLLHLCFADSASQPPDTSTQDAMAVDEIEMAAPTAVGVESGAQNVRSHEEDFALSGRRVDGGSRLAGSSNRLI